MADSISVCLTGGPCSGKSTAIELLKDIDEIDRYRLLLVPEAATLLNTHGMTPNDGVAAWEGAIFGLQVYFDRLYREYADSINDNTIIIHDRGIQDTKCYTDDDTYEALCRKHSIDDVYDMYDHVIHLVSVAHDRPELYNRDNKSRMETLEEARDAEKRTLESSSHCKNLTIIGNAMNDFDDKFNKIIGTLKGLIAQRSS